MFNSISESALEENGYAENGHAKFAGLRQSSDSIVSFSFHFIYKRAFEVTAHVEILSRFS